MDQASKAAFDNNQLGRNYSEILSLLRSMHSMMQAREEHEASILRSSSDSAPPSPPPAPITSQLSSNIQVDCSRDCSLVTHIPSENLLVESLGVTEDHIIQPSAADHGSYSPDIKQVQAEFLVLSRSHSMPEKLVGVKEGPLCVSVPSTPHIQIGPVVEPMYTQEAGAPTARAPDPLNNLPAQASNPPALTSIFSSLHKTISDLQ
ncbi:hypothetical protein BDP27DRAFT_1433952 [Rhodocollybia butyracea]|uniref:Uncharacterized protein n=1 Tax=Rhodocollybia butyracea TaxID=206335 RepID=A0A9P5P6M5_9AGAR|nr:hypothetical protein BDP27DRAFT_1433952 [Rhodocollybia butyracea]